MFHSQDLESPFFLQISGTDYVRFRQRVALATSTKGGVYDLWLTPMRKPAPRRFLANWSDRWPEVGNAGGTYFMIEERTQQSGSGTAVVGTLVRLGPTYEEEARIEGVSMWSAFSAPPSWIYEDPSNRACPGFPDRQDTCPQVLFQRPPAIGNNAATMYLWDGRFELAIGPDSGGFQNQIAGSGSIYCILGDKHTLSRFSRPSNKLDSLRDNVSNFSISGDERYVVLSVTDEGKSKTVIRDMRTGAEITPMRPNPSGWGGIQGSTFAYTQNATSTSQAEIHALDLVTGEDKFVLLPKPLVNQVSKIDRPNSDEALRIDSLGHGVFTGKDDLVARRVLQGPLLVPSFTRPDGKYLIHVARARSTLYDPDPQGALMFQDADATESDTMVSPPGLILNVRSGAPYFFTGDGKVLAFWAHLGRASSDLYFADYEPGSMPTNLRLVAQSIMSVSVSAHNLFGIVNVSQQDGVGDLVYRDIDKGTDIRYAQAVSDAAQLVGADLSSSWSAYVVRGRADSDRSGLWITPLAPPAADAGTD